jgi:alpha-tubulin suppressor-like RCC1 family protein
MRPTLIATFLFNFGLALASPAAELNLVWNSPASVPISAPSFTATGHTLTFTLNFAPALADELTVVKNTGLAFVQGSFANLHHGQLVKLSHAGVDYFYVANFYGGTGNDVMLVRKGSALAAWGMNDRGQLARPTGGPATTPAMVTGSAELRGATILSLAEGENHTLALCSDGRILAWGLNNFGQLGLNHTVNTPNPTPVNTNQGVSALQGKTVVAIAAGYSFSVALCSDGTVATWGRNDAGSLGQGTVGGADVLVPTAVNTAPGVSALHGKFVVAISANYGHVLALCSDGTLVGWGYNSSGQVGDGTTTSRPFPVNLEATEGISELAGRQVVEISTGYQFSIARCADGNLLSWGGNVAGQLGNGTTTQKVVPSLVSREAGLSALYGRSVTRIRTGIGHVLALCHDSTVVGWGGNGSGQIGTGSGQPKTFPTEVSRDEVNSALANRTVNAVWSGWYHSLAVCTDGSIVSWGYNANYGLGNGTNLNSFFPGLVDRSTFPAGAIPKLDIVRSMGRHSVLPLVPAPTVDLVAAAPGTTAVLPPNGVVNLGSSSVNTAANVAALQIRNLGSAAATELSATISGPDAPDFTFGSPFPSKIDPGSPITPSIVFTPTALGPRRATLTISSALPEVAPLVVELRGTGSGALTAYFAMPNTEAYTTDAFSATGSTLAVTVASSVPPGTSLKVIDQSGVEPIDGEFSNLPQGGIIDIDFDGTTHHYIANYYGGDGNDLELVAQHNHLLLWGTTHGIATPTDPSGNVPRPLLDLGSLEGKTVIKVATGTSHTLALCSDGTLHAWGQNDHGQLGVAGIVSSQGPIPISIQSGASVLHGKTVVDIAAGYFFSLALCSDGTLAAWGKNDLGQLGVGDLLNRFVPTGSSYNGGNPAAPRITAITAGGNHALALRADGSLIVWGIGDLGQTGAGVFSSTPQGPVVLQIYQSPESLSLLPITHASAGARYTLVRCTDGSLHAWGGNSDGQLGTNNTKNYSLPTRVNAAEGVSELFGRSSIEVASAGFASIARCTDGSILSWGSGPILGDDSVTSRYAPGLVNLQFGVSSLAGKTILELVAGAGTVFAVCDDGTLHSWGYNSIGQLGDGTTVARSNASPVDLSMIKPGERLLKVFAGSLSNQSAAIIADGAAPKLTVSRTGAETLADNTTLAFAPAPLADPRTPISITVENTGNHPLSDLALSFEGADAAAFSASPSLPTSLAPGQSAIIQISFTPLRQGGHTASLHLDSDARSLTLSLEGTATLQISASYTTGLEVPVSLTKKTDLTGSTVAFTLNYLPTAGTSLWVLKNDSLDRPQGRFNGLAQGQTVTLSYGGTTFDFVANYYGGDGNDLVLVWKNTRIISFGGSIGPFPTPIAPGALEGKTILKLGSNGNVMTALTAEGELISLGTNYQGQTGTGANAVVPTLVNAQQGTSALYGRSVVSLSVGLDHSLALCSDGSIVAWGRNTYGQLGDGTIIQRSYPVLVNADEYTSALFGRRVIAVEAGSSFSLALCSDGTLVSWGRNDTYQLGNGTSVAHPLPTPATAVSDAQLTTDRIRSLQIVGDCTYALLTDGSIWVWGGSSSPPVSLSVSEAGSPLEGHRITQLSTSTYHFLYLTEEGELVASGNNYSGELGIGPPFTSSPPVLVNTTQGVSALNGKTITQIYAVGSSSRALCTDGSMASWGANVGDGTTANREYPTSPNPSFLAPGERFIALAQQTTSSPAYILSALANVGLEVVSSAGIPIPTGSTLALTGGNPFGDSAVQTFTLRNTGTTAIARLSFTLDGADADRFDLTNDGLTIAPGQEVTLNITFTPDRLGSHEANLHIHAEVGGPPLVTTLHFTAESEERTAGPVRIHTASDHLIAAAGDDVALSVFATGAPTITYKWTRNGATVGGGNLTTLNLAKVRTAQAGLYQCAVANVVAGKRTTLSSGTINLAVVDTSLRALVQKVGTSATLSAPAGGKDLSYQWLKGGIPIPGAISQTLRLTKLDRTATDTYACRITSPGGSLEGGRYNLAVIDTAPTVLVPSQARMPDALVGAAYAYPIATAPESYRQAARYTARGLPSGLRIDGQTGLITGTPTVANETDYLITITASNAVGTASTVLKLKVSPLPLDVLGQYTATIPRDDALNQTLGGILSATVTKTGAASGKLTLGTKTYSFRGLVVSQIAQPNTVALGASIKRTGTTPLNLVATLDRNTQLLTGGSLSDGTTTVSFDGWRHSWDAMNPANDYAGTYNFRMSCPPDRLRDPLVPQGVGFASCKVSTTGGLTVTGRMGDGTPITWSTTLGPTGQIAVFKSLYPGATRGSLLGNIVIRQLAPFDALTMIAQQLSWSRSATPSKTQRLYKAGFGPLEPVFFGSRYSAPVAPQIFLDLDSSRMDNATLRFFAPTTGIAITPEPGPDVLASINSTNQVTLPTGASNPRNTRLTINPTQGTFSGSFTLVDPNPLKPTTSIRRTATFMGTIIRERVGPPRAYGYYLLPELPANEGETPSNTPIRSGLVTLDQTLP